MLNVTERDWVSKVSSLAVAKQEYEEDRARKEMAMREMLGELEPLKDTIKSGMNFKLKKKGGGSLKSLTGDQEEELDTEEAKDTYGISPEDAAKSQRAMEQVVAMVEKLRKQTKTITETTTEQVKLEDGTIVERTVTVERTVPLYTDQELIDEFYTPLVRQGLIPENLVPGKYSETQQMLDATNKLYQERVDKYTEELEGATELDVYDHAQTAVDELGNIAQLAAKMFPDGEQAAKVIALVQLGLSTTITVTKAIAKDDLIGSADQIINNIGKLATGIIAAAIPGDSGKAISETFSKVYTASTSAVKIGAHLAKDPPDVEAAIGAFAEGVTAAFAAGNPDGSNVAASVAGEIIPSLIRNAANAVAIAKAVEAGDRDEVIRLITVAANDAITAGMKVAGAVQKDGQSKASQEQIDKQIQELTKTTTEIVDLASLGVTTVAHITDAAKKKDIHGMADELVASLGAILTGVMKKVAPDAAPTVGAAYKSVTSVGLIASNLTQDPPNVSKALECFGNGFSEAMGMINPKNPAFKQVGDGVNSAFISAARSKDILDALQDDPPRYADVIGNLNQLTQGVLSTALQLPDESETLTEEQQKIKDSFTVGNDLVNTFREELAKPGAAEEMLAELQAKQEQEAMDEVANAGRDAERILIQVDEAGETAAAERSIEQLMAQMMKDRVILELATGLVSGGVAVVSKFVEPLAIAGTAIELAKNLMAAAERAMALNKWIKNQKDAEAAMSPYKSSCKNFVKNQSEQFSHYTIQAALKLAEMIGQIVSCSGIASGAGVAVSKSAALASAAENVTYKVYKAVDLERAWKVTQKSLKNPANRKLGLIVRGLNPTLAKYTLAYGAMEKGDPICKSAMASCGLNELTLSNESANVDKVQAYLEMLYNEDNIVLKAVPQPDWMPGKIEVTPKCWSVARSRGVRLANLLDEATPIIDEGLASVADLHRICMSEDGTSKDCELLTAELESLETAFDAYRPVTDKKHEQPGTLHEDMDNLKDKFVDSVQTMLFAAEKRRAELEGEEMFNEEFLRLANIDAD